MEAAVCLGREVSTGLPSIGCQAQRGREERKKVSIGQSVRLQLRGHLATAAVEQLVHCSRAAG